MGVILDLLLALVVWRAFSKFLGGVVAGLNRPRPQSPAARPQSAASGIQMARDPICGTFVVPGRAIELAVGGERIYFCSVECRDKFRADAAGRSASLKGQTA
jgi:YHS domain-containing protein